MTIYEAFWMLYSAALAVFLFIVIFGALPRWMVFTAAVLTISYITTHMA